MSGYVIFLGHADDAADVGGKAFNLCRMLRLGIAVPPGLIVTRGAFEAFIAENDLRDRINLHCAELGVDSAEKIKNASQALCEQIMRSRLPHGLPESLAAHCGHFLEQGPVIVRSSGIGEDAGHASFAGQLDSIGDIAQFADVERAVLACWASYWSERSLFYQLARGVRLEGMGVVIQQQIDAAISGVLFTRDPAGRDDDMLLEYCAGPGDNLSSGRETPTGVRIPRRRDARRPLQARHAPAGMSPAAGIVLDEDTIRRLAKIGKKLEAAFGQPQDIEWTVDASRRLHVVQSRPITASLQHTSGGRGEKVTWSNANINENFPEPVSPFLYSIASQGYYHYFRNLALAFGISGGRIRRMDGSLRNLIGLHAGRMYYNLTNIHAALRMAPFGDALAAAFNDFVGAGTVTSSPRLASTWESDDRNPLFRWAEALAIFVRISWLYLGLSRRVGEFETTVADFSRRTHPDRLSERTLVELSEHVDEFVDIRCNRWLGASLADCSAMVCHGILRHFLDRGFPGSGEATLHNTLLKGLPNLVSAEPAQQLWRLSRCVRNDPRLLELFDKQSGEQIWQRISTLPEHHEFHAALQAFLEQWGFRFSGELLLTVPSYQENPGGLMELLGTYALLVGDSPLDVMREQARARELRTAQVLDEFRRHQPLPYIPGFLQAHVVRLILTWTQRSIILRERARLKQALLYSRCRRILLTIGTRLVEAGYLRTREDVFWFMREELLDAIAGRSPDLQDLATLADVRRNRAERWHRIELPDTFELEQGEQFRQAAGCPDDLPEGARRAPEIELRGIGACGGVVTAPAQPLRDLNESRLLSPGDVLVTRQTDPGWGPLFFIAGGLVLERGGMLSHGAILAREYGLPCVVAVDRALERIAAGQTVTVDGDREIVRIVQ